MGGWGDFWNQFAVGLNETLPRELARSNQERRETQGAISKYKALRPYQEEALRLREKLDIEQEESREGRRLGRLYGPKGAGRIKDIGEEAYKQELEAEGLPALMKMLEAEEPPDVAALSKLPTRLQAEGFKIAESKKAKLAEKATKTARSKALAKQALPFLPEGKTEEELVGLDPSDIVSLITATRTGEAATARAGEAEAKSTLATEKAAREQEKFEASRKDQPIDLETHAAFAPTYETIFKRPMPKDMKVSVFEQTKSILEGNLKAAEKKPTIPESVWKGTLRQVMGDAADTRSPTPVEIEKAKDIQRQDQVKTAAALMKVKQKDVPVKASPAERKKIAGLDAAMDATKRIEKLFRPEHVGPIQGPFKGFMGYLGKSSPSFEEFKAEVATARNAVILEFSGTAASASEERRMVEQVPTINDPDARFMAKLRVTQRNLQTLRQRTLDQIKGAAPTQSLIFSPSGEFVGTE